MLDDAGSTRYSIGPVHSYRRISAASSVTSATAPHIEAWRKSTPWLRSHASSLRHLLNFTR
jgi:hypothetical protein